VSPFFKYVVKQDCHFYLSKEQSFKRNTYRIAFPLRYSDPLAAISLLLRDIIHYILWFVIIFLKICNIFVKYQLQVPMHRLRITGPAVLNCYHILNVCAVQGSVKKIMKTENRHK
jgi:hypothetical protein